LIDLREETPLSELSYRAQASATAAPALRLLGGLRIEAQRDHSFPSRRAATAETRHHVQAVLAIVGSALGGVERDHVVDALWPTSGAAAGRNRLYHTVHLARQALSAAAWDDEWIFVRNSRVVLDGRIWCDAQELERAGNQDLQRLDDERLQALTALCQDDWMPGLHLGGEGDSIRARVRRAQSALLREAIRRLRAQGDTPTLRARLDHLLRLEPTDESTHRELMALDLAAGRRHAVLRTFEKISRELSEQLGLKPTAPTRALADAAAAQLASVPSPRQQAATTLIGREPLIQPLVEQLASRGGIWNLTGLSGVGKTTVAREVMRRLEHRLPEGCTLVRLGDLSTHDTAASACVRALGLASYDQRTDLELLHHALRMRPLLLVLDDLDFAVDSQALLQSLPESMPARVIITSRVPLKLAGATTMSVPPLDTPPAELSLERARQYPSVALFVMRCAVTGSETQSQAWQRDVVRLVHRLDGLPLAIELAAARSATMTPGEIVEQIGHDLGPLAHGPLNLETRHRSMQSSLNWSVRLLGGAARCAYMVASVFPGTFLRQQLQQLAPVVALHEASVDDAIDELLAAGLLATADDSPRLRMLHLPRAHARSLAVERGLWSVLLNARLEEVCSQFAQHPLRYESPAYMRNLRHIIALEEDAVALLDHARIHEQRRFVALTAALCESWMCRNLAGPVVRWASGAVAVAKAVGDDDNELFLRLNLALALRRAGQSLTAEAQSQAMLPLMDRVADAALVAWAGRARSVVLRNVGYSRAAADLCRQTIDRLRLRPGDEGYLTLAAELMSWGHLEYDDIDLSALRGRLAGSRIWLTLLENSFMVRAVRGDWRELRQVADEIVDICRQAGWNSALLSGLWKQALCAFADDRLDEGLDRLHAHIALARGTGWNDGVSLATYFVCNVHWREGQMDAARSSLAEALACDQLAGSQATAVRAPVARATVLLLGGQASDALDEMLRIPLDRLDHIAHADLAGWSELGALMARHFGDAQTAHELAGLMRQFDSADDQLPYVKRFRDRLFGPDTAPGRLNREEIGAFDPRLRAAIVALHAKLPSYRTMLTVQRSDDPPAPERGGH
jgi:predicted ATPase/DNA-binding SARP family transcriptional activator